MWVDVNDEVYLYVYVVNMMVNVIIIIQCYLYISGGVYFINIWFENYLLFNYLCEVLMFVVLYFIL